MLKLPALILAENVHHSFVTLCICILMKLKKAHEWLSGVKRNSCLDSSFIIILIRFTTSGIVLFQPRTQGILFPVSENGPGIVRSHDLKISSIWGVQL
jgi:hypothetical protein